MGALGEIRGAVTVAPWSGLNNQKMCLAGLIISARQEKKSYVLPRYLCDFRAGGKWGKIRTEDVFDLRGLGGKSGFAQNLSHRYCFNTCKYVLSDPSKESAALEIVNNMKPSQIVVERAESIKRNLPENYTAVQLRIESDWHRHQGNLGERKGREIVLDAGRIFDKIKACSKISCADIVALCNQEDLVQSKSELEDIARRKGFRLHWTQGKGSSPLMSSAIDFEIAVAANCYVGLQDSTFSQMCAVSRSSRSGGKAAHYVYDLAGDEVVQQWATPASLPR